MKKTSVVILALFLGIASLTFLLQQSQCVPVQVFLYLCKLTAPNGGRLEKRHNLFAFLERFLHLCITCHSKISHPHHPRQSCPFCGLINSWLISKSPYQQLVVDKELIVDKVVLINKDPYSPPCEIGNG